METVKIRVHKKDKDRLGAKQGSEWAANLRHQKKNPTFKPKREGTKELIFSIPQVNKIRMMFESGHISTPQLAKLFKCNQNVIYKIVKYQSYIIDQREKSLIEMQNDGDIDPDHGI